MTVRPPEFAVIAGLHFGQGLSPLRVWACGVEPEICVIDEGPGVPVEQRQSTFQPSSEAETPHWHLKGISNNCIRVFMVSIRRKSESDPEHPRWFIADPGLWRRVPGERKA